MIEKYFFKQLGDFGFPAIGVMHLLDVTGE